MKNELLLSVHGSPHHGRFFTFFFLFHLRLISWPSTVSQLSSTLSHGSLTSLRTHTSFLFGCQFRWWSRRSGQTVCCWKKLKNVNMKKDEHGLHNPLRGGRKPEINEKMPFMLTLLYMSQESVSSLAIVGRWGGREKCVKDSNISSLSSVTNPACLWRHCITQYFLSPHISHLIYVFFTLTLSARLISALFDSAMCPGTIGMKMSAKAIWSYDKYRKHCLGNWDRRSNVCRSENSRFLY